MAPKPHQLQNLVRGAEAARRMRVRFEQLGTTLSGHKLWTAGEDETCRRLHPDRKAIWAALPHRSYEAVKIRCNVLGLSKKKHMWTGEQKARLRRMYPSATQSELLAAFPFMTKQGMHSAAYRFGFKRARKPYKETGHPALDRLRTKCFELGLNMADLDAISGGKGFFRHAKWHRNSRKYRTVAWAAKALGGQMTVEWRDDDED